MTSKWSNVLEKLGYCKIQVNCSPSGVNAIRTTKLPVEKGHPSFSFNPSIPSPQQNKNTRIYLYVFDVVGLGEKVIVSLLYLYIMSELFCAGKAKKCM